MIFQEIIVIVQVGDYKGLDLWCGSGNEKVCMDEKVFCFFRQELG